MQGSYDPVLVLLSIVTAVIAAFVALDMASRVASARENNARNARLLLAGGALAMGTGIWSMHFVGMLAFSLPVPLAYEIRITALSWLVAVLSSALALQTVSRPHLVWTHLIGAGGLMGIGIASMHYLGMEAMQMQPGIEYSPWLFSLSVLLAIAAATAALRICFWLRHETAVSGVGKKVGAAMVMGVAIAGMHYTGMAAANFAEGSVCSAGPYSLGGAWLAFAISGLVALFLVTTLLRSVYRALPPTVQSRLVFLVLAAVLPVSMMAVGVMVYDYQRLRAQQVSGLLVGARALVATVDKDVASIEMGLRVLSTSRTLDDEDLPGFHLQAVDALAHLRVAAIQLEDGNGKLLMDTRRSMRIAASSADEALARTSSVAMTPGPSHPGLTVPSVAATAERGVTVSIPVPQVSLGVTGRSPMLRARLTPDRLGDLLKNQLLAPDWIATVYDPDGKVVVRSQEMIRFVGSQAPPSLQSRLSQVREGTLGMVSLEGIPVLSAFSRSENTGWTASVSIPLAALDAPLLSTMAWLFAGLLGILGLSLLLAWRIGGTISGAVRALTEPALALGSGKTVEVPPLGLTEADKVGRALTQASRLLDSAQHDANHDALTGLANRTLFRQMVQQQLALAQRNASDMCVLYLDLDGFKGVNDNHGHHVGDALLKQVAQRLQQGVRAGDVVARLGGDEFAVALTQPGPRGPAKVARKLIESMCVPFVIGRLSLDLSASIGGAIYSPAAANNCDTLLEQADAAMYQAKQAGKRRFVLAEPVTAA